MPPEDRPFAMHAPAVRPPRERIYVDRLPSALLGQCRRQSPPNCTLPQTPLVDEKSCTQTQTGLDCTRTRGNAKDVAVTRRLPDWLVLIFLLLAIVATVVVTGVWLEA